MSAAILFTASAAVRADCIDDAAARHQVNAIVLRAIGWHESRLQPLARHRDVNGSTDIGAFQINDIHVPELQRLGVSRDSLSDGCVSAEVAAWHYRRQVDRFGNTWTAIGAYHSLTSPRGAWYANQVATVLMQWRVMPPGPLPFDPLTTLEPGSTSMRRMQCHTQEDPFTDSGASTSSACDAHVDAGATPLPFQPSAR